MTKEREAEILQNSMAYASGQSGYEDRRDLLDEIDRLRKENERLFDMAALGDQSLREKLAKARRDLQWIKARYEGACKDYCQGREYSDRATQSLKETE